MGYELATHHAFGWQPRCRSRSEVSCPAPRAFVPAARFRQSSARYPSVASIAQALVDQQLRSVGSKSGSPKAARSRIIYEKVVARTSRLADDTWEYLRTDSYWQPPPEPCNVHTIRVGEIASLFASPSPEENARRNRVRGYRRKG